MSKKSGPKFFKIVLITIGAILASIFFLLTVWGLLAIAGGSILVNQLFNEVILQNHNDRTMLTPVNSTTNKLSSASDYTVDVPSSYRILDEDGFSSDPLSITLGNNDGEIRISRDAAYDTDEGPDNNLKDYFNSTNLISHLIDPRSLMINGNEAIRDSDSRGQYVYYIFVKDGIGKNKPAVFSIYTENKNFSSDVDTIAQSFKFTYK